MDGPYDKQRRFPRVPAECPVLVRKLEGDRATRLTCTKVVGMGGCMFQHDKPFGEGTAISILILVQGRYLEARARVVYEIPRTDQMFDVGVEFLDIPDEDLEALKELFVESPKEK